MIEGDFDRWTLANMNAALDDVCGKIPHGEDHAVRKRIARQIIKCAKSGRTSLGELTAAGQRALAAASRNDVNSPAQVAHREDSARGA
jgi:hypothetical protein